MGRIVYIDVDLKKKQALKEFEKLEKELQKKVKNIKRINDITPNIDTKKAKKQAEKLTVDVKKEYEKLNKNFKFEPTIGDKKLNDELKNVRQNLEDFYKRIDSADADSYAKRVTEMERYKKSLTQLKNIAEKTGDIDIANELGVQLEKFKIKTTQAKAELRNFAKTGENNVSVLGKLFNEVTGEIEKSREELIRLGKSTKGLDKLEKEIEQVNRDFKSGKINAQQYAQSLQKINNNSKKATKETKSLGGAMTKLIGAAAGYAVFDKAKDYVLSMDKAVTKLRITTGASQEELEDFKKSARNLQKSGFGDFDKNLETLSGIKRSLKITGKEAEQVAKNMLIISENFSESESEIFKATNGLAKNMKLSFGDAGDYILKALQKTNDPDLMDNIAEYSVNFDKIGYSAKDMFNIMIKGAENGAYKLDKVNDAIKEAEDALTDNSKSTRDAFSKMGLNYDEYLGKLQKGEIEVKDILEVVNKKLLGLEAGVQDEVGTAIYKEKWVDLSDEVLIGLTGIEDKLGDVTGTTEELSRVTEESLGGSWAKLKGKTGPFFDHMSKSLAGLMLKILEVGEDIFIKFPSFLGRAINSLIDKIYSFFGRFYQSGKDIIISLGNGIKNTDIKGTIKKIGDSIINYLKILPAKALKWGANLGKSFANGLKSSIANIKNSVYGIATKVKRVIGVNSPTDEGPLALDQSIWGKNLGTTWAKGLDLSLPTVRKAIEKIAKEASELSNIQLKYKTIGSVQAQTSKLNTKLDTLEFGSAGFEETKKQLALLGELQKKYSGQEMDIEKKLKELKEKNYKSVIKNADKIAKANGDNADDLLAQYKARRKAIEYLLEKEKEYAGDSEKLVKINEEITDYKKEMGKVAEKIYKEEEKAIENLQKKLKKTQKGIEDLQNKLAENVNKKDISIAERKLEIEKERKKVLEDIAKLDNTGSLGNKSKQVQNIDKDLEGNLSESRRNKLLDKKAYLLEQINEKIKNANNLNGKAYELKQKLAKLNNEEEIVDKNLNADSLIKVEEENSKSKTEKILEDFQKEQDKIKEKLEVQLKAFDEEKLAFDTLTAEKIANDNLFTENNIGNIEKINVANNQMLENARSVIEQIRALTGASGIEATFTATKSNEDGTTTTIQRTINNNISNTIQYPVDERKLTRSITNSIARAEKTGNKI